MDTKSDSIIASLTTALKEEPSTILQWTNVTLASDLEITIDGTNRSFSKGDEISKITYNTKTKQIRFYDDSNRLFLMFNASTAVFNVL